MAAKLLKSCIQCNKCLPKQAIPCDYLRDVIISEYGLANAPVE